MMLLKFFEILGLVYAISLIFFRHSTFEEDSILSSLFDILPFGGLLAISVFLVPFLGNLPPQAVSLAVGGIGLALARNLHTKHVAGSRFAERDLTNNVYIVTGSNTGIGFETSRELARMNSTVVLACRSVDKANVARLRIINSTNCAPSKVIVMALDLCSFPSVRQFVKEFLELKLPLHGLVNNAGIMLAHKEITKDGLETVFTANHLSHFLLTNLLLPHMDQQSGRVVVLSSSLHRLARGFNFADVMSVQAYSLFGTYSQSKLANILFGFELQRRLVKKGVGITCNVVHPGTVATEVSRHMGGLMTTLETMVAPLLSLLRKTPLQGAYSSIYATISPDLNLIGGKYLFNSRSVTPSEVCYDQSQASKLWDLSEELTNFKSDYWQVST